MATWAQFEQSQPELARRVQERFEIRKHKTMATLRKDGSPRISGIELAFEDGEVYLGSMPRARKADDLRRDPRLAIHSPTDDPPEGAPAAWGGEAKLAGRAIEVAPDRFRVDITDVALTHLNPEATRLVVESWNEKRGYQRVERE
jgi:pyridoxamine 5'-phosphate oxidase-like protein